MKNRVVGATYSYEFPIVSDKVDCRAQLYDTSLHLLIVSTVEKLERSCVAENHVLHLP